MLRNAPAAEPARLFHGAKGSKTQSRRHRAVTLQGERILRKGRSAESTVIIDGVRQRAGASSLPSVSPDISIVTAV